MKVYPLLILVAVLTGCAQTPAAGGSETPAVSASATAGEGRRGGRGERLRKMIKEMDTDHDGKLSDAEKEVGFDKLVADSDRFRKRVDKDGDGKISPEERSEGLKTFMKRRARRPQDASPAPS